MKIDPFLSDETTIAPPTPGAALVRLSQTLGALRRLPNATSMPEIAQKLARLRDQLQNALENGENLGTPFAEAQNSLRSLYFEAAKIGDDADQNAEFLLALGFPDPRATDPEFVAPVDVLTVVATHFKPQKQVFSTISFAEAHGATAYWLFEIRGIANAPQNGVVLDALLENFAPYFSRARLPVGAHRFFIESRNASKSARSQEFVLEVPAL